MDLALSLFMEFLYNDNLEPSTAYITIQFIINLYNNSL